MRVIVRNPPSPHDRGAVAWDVDATLWDFLAGFYDLIRAEHAHLPVAPPEGGSVWAFVVDAVGIDAARAVLPRLYEPDVMARYGCLPGAVEATHAVRAAGARVIVMTHRPPEAADGTARFLDEHGVHWDELRCGFDCKVTACGELGASVIVDDRPQTLELAVERGIRAFTIWWPHNAEVCARHPITHARGYDELLPAILAALEAAPPCAGR